MASPYEPLPSSEHIRILTIESDEENAILRCQIRAERLADVAGRYLALSYVWGAPSDQEAIYVNGQKVMIPSTLVVLLKYFRRVGREGNPLNLWADSICINQNDMAERSSQVGKMKEIYEQGHDVLAWLGPQADESDLAFDLIIALNEFSWKHAKVADDGAEPFHIQGQIMPALNYVQNAIGNDCLSHIFAFLSLLQRPWWQRTWIMQEATTDHHTTICCGPRMTSLNAIFIASLYCRHMMQPLIDPLSQNSPHSHSSELPALATEHLDRINEFRRPQLRGGEYATHLDLLTIVSFFPSTKASDPRDKIFAPVSLFDSNHPGRCIMDYSMPVAEVFTLFASTCITATSRPNLDVLGYTSQGDINDTDRDIPSWVPDWRQVLRRQPLRKALKNLSKDPPESVYAADSPLWKLDVPERLHAKPVGRELHVRGVFLDKIVSLTDSAAPSTVELRIDRWFRWFTGPEGSYFTGETRERVYLRSILADAYGTGDFRTGRRLGSSDLDIRNVQNDRMGICQVHEAIIGRRMAITTHRLLALVPKEAEEGDLIYIVCGGQVPLLLRRAGARYTYVGECYVHGVMDGEVLDVVKSQGRDVELERIVIQ